MDAFNHRRKEKVSWSVSGTNSDSLAISLITHTPAKKGDELFNNYGGKGNGELILGYGFSLEGNEDDVMLLIIGGGDNEGKKKREFEVRRDGEGFEEVWKGVRDLMRGEGEEGEKEEWEVELDVGGMLGEMIGRKLDALPSLGSDGDGMREDVRKMWGDYISGSFLSAFLAILVI